MVPADQDCEALWLTAPNGTRFKFLGAREVAKGTVAAEAALAPPDAVGTPRCTPTADLPLPLVLDLSSCMLAPGFVSQAAPPLAVPSTPGTRTLS